MTKEDYAAIFSALGDKTRFTLFQMLVEKPEACVSQLAQNMHISSACVSQHMKILSDAGLVERVRDGQRVCYKVSTNSRGKKILSELIFSTEKQTSAVM